MLRNPQLIRLRFFSVIILAILVPHLMLFRPGLGWGSQTLLPTLALLKDIGHLINSLDGVTGSFTYSLVLVVLNGMMPRSVFLLSYHSSFRLCKLNSDSTFPCSQLFWVTISLISTHCDQKHIWNIPGMDCTTSAFHSSDWS